MSICFNYYGSLKLKEEHKKEFATELYNIAKECDKYTVLKLKVDGSLKFRLFGRWHWIETIENFVKDNVNKIETGRIVCSCYDEGGTEEGFPSLEMIEIINGKVFTETLLTHVSYIWDAYFDKNYNDAKTELKFNFHSDDADCHTDVIESVYVDLGLPSGRLWAKCNVGATNPEEYGDYFMYGSTTPDTNNICDWAHAPFNNGSTSYDEEYFNTHKSEWLDGDVLKPEYDAAHVAMGGDWRMPTSDDFAELVEHTNKEWVFDYKGSGVNGYLFTSKSNGNTLFIPASGLRCGTSVGYQGNDANLWSSSLDAANPGDAWELYFNSVGIGHSLNDGRYNGFCVRGVL